MNHPVIARWHEFVRSKNPVVLNQLLAEDVSFHSPVVHTPQQGRDITSLYLVAAAHIFDDSFHYVREIIGERQAALEFVVTIDAIQINGVDLISWNEKNRIDDFKVMIRPLKAIGKVHEKMAARLAGPGP